MHPVLPALGALLLFVFAGRRGGSPAAPAEPAVRTVTVPTELPRETAVAVSRAVERTVEALTPGARAVESTVQRALSPETRAAVEDTVSRAVAAVRSAAVSPETRSSVQNAADAVVRALNERAVPVPARAPQTEVDLQAAERANQERLEKGVAARALAAFLAQNRSPRSVASRRIVQGYQRTLGVTPDGIVGPRTREAIAVYSAQVS